jgi:hypothetical protein
MSARDFVVMAGTSSLMFVAAERWRQAILELVNGNLPFCVFEIAHFLRDPPLQAQQQKLDTRGTTKYTRLSSSHFSSLSSLTFANIFLFFFLSFFFFSFFFFLFFFQARCCFARRCWRRRAIRAR